MPTKLKWKVYGSDQASSAITGRHMGYSKATREAVELNEMRMLRWMCGVTHKDKFRNEHMRWTTRVFQEDRGVKIKLVVRRDDTEENVRRRIIQGKGREEDRKQDGKTRTNDT